MWTAHVPVEVFRFQVEREHVRQNGVHCSGNVLGGGTCQIGPGCQWSIASLAKLCSFCRIISLHIVVLYALFSSIDRPLAMGRGKNNFYLLRGNPRSSLMRES